MAHGFRSKPAGVTEEKAPTPRGAYETKATWGELPLGAGSASHLGVGTPLHLRCRGPLKSVMRRMPPGGIFEMGPIHQKEVIPYAP